MVSAAGGSASGSVTRIVVPTPPSPGSTRDPDGRDAAVAEAPAVGPGSEESPSPPSELDAGPAEPDADVSAADAAVPPPSIAQAELPSRDTRVVVPLTEHVRNHIRNVARREHHARARIVDGVYLRATDGSSRALVVYEFSRWESCVYGGGGDAAARESCLYADAFSVESPRPELRECNALVAMRIDFAPPAASAAEATGDVGYVVRELDAHGCQLGALHELALRDVDVDGHAELVIDATRTWPDYQGRGEIARIDDAQRRTWQVLREDDLAPEIEITRWDVVLSANEGYTEDMTNASTTRFELRDVNGDRHPDIVMEHASYSLNGDCGLDADHWPDPEWRSPDGWGCHVSVAHHLARYSRGEDAWAVVR